MPTLCMLQNIFWIDICLDILQQHHPILIKTSLIYTQNIIIRSILICDQYYCPLFTGSCEVHLSMAMGHIKYAQISSNMWAPDWYIRSQSNTYRGILCRPIITSLGAMIWYSDCVCCAYSPSTDPDSWLKSGGCNNS